MIFAHEFEDYLYTIFKFFDVDIINVCILVLMDRLITPALDGIGQGITMVIILNLYMCNLSTQIMSVYNGFT